MREFFREFREVFREFREVFRKFREVFAGFSKRSRVFGCVLMPTRALWQRKIITKIPTNVRREKFRIETKRNENGTNSKRKRNGTKLGRRVVAEIRGDVWVAVWWPKFWPKSGSPCGGRNFGRKKFSLRTKVTVVN